LIEPPQRLALRKTFGHAHHSATDRLHPRPLPRLGAWNPRDAQRLAV